MICCYIAIYQINKLSYNFKSVLPINTFCHILSDKVNFYVINKKYKLNDYKMNKNIYIPIYNISNISNIKTLYKEDLSYDYPYYSVSLHILYNNLYNYNL